MACQSQIAVLNKVLLLKQRNMTPPPQPSPQVRSRTTSSSCETTYSSNAATTPAATLASQLQSSLSSFASAGDLSLNGGNSAVGLNGIAIAAMESVKKADDSLSLISQKSSSSCVIS